MGMRVVVTGGAGFLGPHPCGRPMADGVDAVLHCASPASPVDHLRRPIATPEVGILPAMTTAYRRAPAS